MTEEIQSTEFSTPKTRHREDPVLCENGNNEESHGLINDKCFDFQQQEPIHMPGFCLQIHILELTDFESLYSREL